MQIYAAPAEWIPAFGPAAARALPSASARWGSCCWSTSGAAIPIHWDGVRGLALVAFLVWAAASHLWILARR